MEEYVPHFNEPLSLPPKLGRNWESVRRSATFFVDDNFFSLYTKIKQKFAEIIEKINEVLMRAINEAGNF